MGSELETPALTSLIASLRSLLERLNRSKNAKIVLSGAVLAIVLKLLLGRRSKGRRYTTNLNAVGEPTGASATSTGPLVDAKYDVIVVGGGTEGQFAVSEMGRHLRARYRRNRRLCPRSTALGGPHHPCSPPRSGRKVRTSAASLSGTMPILFSSKAVRPSSKAGRRLGLDGFCITPCMCMGCVPSLKSRQIARSCFGPEQKC